MKTSSFGAAKIPSPWELPAQNELYPVPELTRAQLQGGIVRIVPPAGVANAIETLNYGFVFYEDQTRPPAVITGIAKIEQPGLAWWTAGSGYTKGRWVDMMARAHVLLVFLPTVTRAPIRFVATMSPMLVAALAQPVGGKHNYAVLNGPEYLIRYAQQLALGGKMSLPLPSSQVNSFMETQAKQEDNWIPLTPASEAKAATKMAQQQHTSSSKWIWLGVGLAATAAAAIGIVAKRL